MIELFSKVPLHLDQSATQEARVLNKEAWESGNIRRSVQRIVELFRELASETAAVSVVSEATRAALQSRCGTVEGVLAQLRSTEQHLDDILVKVLERNSAYAAELEAHRKKMAPTILRVSREALDSEQRIKALQKQISSFDRAREECRKRLEAAGLTTAEIASVGLKPTDSDQAAWCAELADIEARNARIKAFLRSSPAYDSRLLADQAAGA